MTGRDARSRSGVDRMGPWLKIGIGVLLLASFGFGMLEVHYSTDTWIALAAGRAIAAAEEFPVADSFSYTFAGTTWFNQNWLSHLFLWLAYSRLGATALVIVIWGLGITVFLLVLLATRERTGSWPASAIAACLVAITCRDWLSIRPATVQLVLLAAQWLALSALTAASSRRRWWPVAVLGVVLVAWPHAHGSFLLGYGLAALWIGCAILPRVLGRETVTADRHLVAVSALTAVCLSLSVALSPYGADNLLHSFKVAGSDVFRQVGEWLPPFTRGLYPPVARFWIAVAMVALGLLAAAMVRRTAARRDLHFPCCSERSPAPAEHLDASALDVLSVVIGLAMALWARRFAPVLFILATPAVTAAMLRWARPLPAAMARHARVAVCAIVWSAALTAASVTAWRAHHDLVDGIPRPTSLLERVTELHRTPAAGLRFLRVNGLRANVFTEWKLAGPVMFFAPGVKVFIDGRSQQVYDEAHYLEYRAVATADREHLAEVLGVLSASGTDLALLPRWWPLHRLCEVLASSNEWIPLLEEPDEALYLRRASPVLGELTRRERAGTLWWPDLASACAGRGSLLALAKPASLAQAVAWWRRAVDRRPGLGPAYYPSIATGLIALGRTAEGLEYFAAMRVQVSASPDLTVSQRAELLRSIAWCEHRLQGAGVTRRR